MPSETNNKHFAVKEIILGRNNLYKPRAFKNAAGDKKKDANQKPSGPKYNLEVVFDPKDPKQKAYIDLINERQDNAIQELIDREEWNEDVKPALAFCEADTTKVQESESNKKLVILSKKRPELKGKWLLKCKRKSEQGRPCVRYVSELGDTDMPEPILCPDPDDPDEVNEADRIEAFWHSMVFSGQYADVSATFTAWVVSPTSQGVSARIDNIRILGGGTPVGFIPFEADFGDDEFDDAKNFLAKVNPRYKLPPAWHSVANPIHRDQPVDGGREPYYEEGPEPERNVRSKADEFDDVKDPDEVPVRKTAQRPKRRTAIKPTTSEPVDDYNDVEYEEEPPRRPRRRPATRHAPVESDEGYDDEYEEPRRPRRRTAVKPTPVEPADEYDSDEVDEYDI